LDKMKMTGADSLLQGMSTQVIKIDKASVHAQLISKTSVLAAANPRAGRFEDSVELSGQLKVHSELMSRFDLAFILRDLPDEEIDEASGSHILTYWDDEDALPLDRDLLIKYISVAKRYTPVIPKNLKREILDYYKDIRNRFHLRSSMPIDKRHLQGIMRLSMASARGRLSNLVNHEDIERATTMISGCIKGLTRDGTMDVDMLESGISGDTRQLMTRVYDIFLKLWDVPAYRAGAPASKVIDIAATEWQVTRERTAAAIRHMVKNKDIYSMGNEVYIKNG